MSRVKPQVFQTNIIDPEIKHIFTLSDIHADIHALIIALRDCAKVIKKKDGFFDNMYSLEQYLLKNLDTDPTYQDDLNYEWCQDNTYLVIIGDIIDGFRNLKPPNYNIYKNNNELEHEYIQIEIKILKFINALNKQALQKSSRIIKLLGNHEVINILDDYQNIRQASQYIFPKTIRETNYYKGQTRSRIFKYGEEGFTPVKI